MVIYRVKEGDTITSIARKHGILPNRLCELNAVPADVTPVPGEALLIDRGGKSCHAREGDTLRAIAARHRIPLSALKRQNPALSGKEDIYPGMTLTLTGEECPPKSATVLGYAPSDAEEGALSPILPYLTYLALTGASVDGGGHFCPAEDAGAVLTARMAGVAPVLTVVPRNEEAFLRVIGDDAGRNTLCEEIAAHMRLRGYGGVLIDAALSLQGDHAAYTALLARLRRLTGHGTAVLGAISPMAIPADRAALAALGRAASALVLTAYDFSTRYGTPAPEAPYDRVGEALSAVSECIRPQRIILGLSTRAEDFPVRGGEGRVLPAAAVPALARKTDGRIAYDPVGRVPYLSYREEGEDRIVFFEDAESYREKLTLLADRGIGGVALFPAVGAAQALLSTVAATLSVVRPYGG